MARTVLAASLAALLAVAAPAGADVIYKVRLKDGSIAFTDKPPPNAVVLEKREFEAAPPTAAAPVPRKADRSAVDERLRKREAEFERANAAVAAAERALAQARENLEKGREPRAGEMTGTARKGFARPSLAYEERIRSLEQAIVDAQTRLDKAIDARNAAR